MIKLPQRQSKLGSYLTVALGAGAAATSAEAATVFYSSGDTGTPWQASAYGPSSRVMISSGGSGWGLGILNSSGFQRSTASISTYLLSSNMPTYIMYKYGPSMANAAQSGNDNYMLYDINGDSTYDSVARFSFNGSGGGYLMAVSQDMAGLTFATGVSNILGSPVAATPEPAGFLLGGVPALIGVGALLRRRVRPGAALGLMALGADGVRARRESAAAA